MDFRLLGPLAVAAQDHPIEVGRAKVRALLAILLLRANDVVTRDQLVDQLWGARPPGNPRATLHSHVALLRRLLESGTDRDLLVTHPVGYSLRVPAERIDIARFEAGVADADRARSAGALDEAVAAYECGLGEWRGPALADFAGEEFAAAPAARLEELRRVAAERRIDAALALGRHAQLVPDLEALAVEEPLREQRWGHLMLALYRTGQAADALAVYQRLRRTLADELGLEPGPRLAQLHEAILRQDPTLDVAPPAPAAPPAAGAAAAPASTARRRVANLPVLLTRFVGRGAELDQVGRLLGDHRLVTLTGAGGVGKSRLAMAVAERALDVSEAAFVPLASLTDPAGIAPAVARVLGIAEDPDRPALETLRREIADRRLLLVLDNLEQLPGAAGPIVELLGACPDVRVLATSRVPLRVGGERRFPVRPLTVPATGAPQDVVDACEAVMLYVDRAQAVRPDFTLDGHVAATAELCVRLDGLPLAIELAAAHAAVLPPRALLDRLPRRIDLPAAPGTDLPARSRTLRATLEWSHNLLGPLARRSFARFAVFVGGATLEAVESVCADPGEDGAVVEALTVLVDSGLVRAEPGGRGQRFRMLETVREYALERLEDSGEGLTRRLRHLEHLLSLAEHGKPPAGFADDRRLEVLNDEAGNLDTALRWATTAGRDELAARLAAALYRWWLSTGRLAEGRQWTGRLLSRPHMLPEPLRAELLLADGFLAANQGHYAEAVERYEAARVLWDRLGNPAGQARSLFGLAAIVGGRHEPTATATATGMLDEALRLARAAGDDLLVVRIVANLGALAEGAGDYPRARDLYAESMAAARRRGWTGEIPRAAASLALTTHMAGAPARAAAIAEEALAAARSTGSPTAVGFVLVLTGAVALAAGDAALARSRYAEALALYRENRQRVMIADCLSGIAAAAQLGGDAERAVRLFGAAHRVLRDAGLDPEPGADRVQHDRQLAAARRQLPPGAFAEAWEAGAQTTVEAAIEAALPPENGAAQIQRRTLVR